MGNSPKAQNMAVEEFINKSKWWDVLSRFIEVLRMNIFIVRPDGVMVLPPEEGRWGGRLLTDKALGFDLLQDPGLLMSKFKPQGQYWESINRFDLRCFAIPINIKQQETLAYMIVGPVILNKRLENDQYEKLAKDFGVNAQDVLGEIGLLRVVSHVMMSAILDLLFEIVKTNIQLALKEQQPSAYAYSKEISGEIDQISKEIYSTVRVDELLATLLDLALKMTATQAGSIMMFDEKEGLLTIKVSRGLGEGVVQKSAVKLGEGIAGLAAKEKTPFFISSQPNSDKRLSGLLKRSEIRESLVMPLISKTRVFGVLNLNANNEQNRIQENLDNLKYLSQLLSSAI